MTNEKTDIIVDWYVQNISGDVWTSKSNNWLDTPDLKHSNTINNNQSSNINSIKSKRLSTSTIISAPKNKTTSEFTNKSKVNKKQENTKSTYIADWIAIAEKSAASSSNLQELKEAVSKFNGCEIKNYAKQSVFSDGNPESKILLLGEAPGEAEDIQGKPFVGESGKLQSEILSSIGLERAKHYLVSNVMYWRPPGNRQPKPEELMLCRPFVKRFISLFDPSLILLLGKTATDSVFEDKYPITKIRGKWKDFTTLEGKLIPCLPSYHPAFLLRQPSRKAEVWQDMLTLQKAIKNLLSKNNIKDYIIY